MPSPGEVIGIALLDDHDDDDDDDDVDDDGDDDDDDYDAFDDVIRQRSAP